MSLTSALFVNLVFKTTVWFWFLFSGLYSLRRCFKISSDWIISQGGFHQLHLVVPSVLSATAAAQQLPDVSQQTAGLWSSRRRGHQGFQLRHQLLQSQRLSWRGLPSHLLWLAHQHQASSQPLSLLQLPWSWLPTPRQIQLCVWSHTVLEEIQFYWISTNYCCHERYVYWSTFTFHDKLLNETKSNSLLPECISGLTSLSSHHTNKCWYI